MSDRWSSWARRALLRMCDLGEPTDAVEAADWQGARQALLAVEETGDEPYVTLKAFVVCKLGLGDGD